MTYYAPYPTPRGFRFRCCMNSESEPFDSSKQCREAAATEERRDRWIAKQPGLRGDIYRAAFKSMNDLAQLPPRSGPNSDKDVIGG